jgi:hypothetical protein
VLVIHLGDGLFIAEGCFFICPSHQVARIHIQCNGHPGDDADRNVSDLILLVPEDRRPILPEDLRELVSAHPTFFPALFDPVRND